VRRSLLVVMCFSAIVLVVFQVVGQYGRAYVIEATVDIKPETLNLNTHGKWITAYIELPDGYNASDINTASILLENMFGVARSSMEGRALMVKFETDRVTEYLWDRLLHMGGYRAHVDLTVQGQLRDSTPFGGKDTITIMDPTRT
jgi:hypothetical protein